MTVKENFVAFFRGSRGVRLAELERLAIKSLLDDDVDLEELKKERRHLLDWPAMVDNFDDDDRAAFVKAWPSTLRLPDWIADPTKAEPPGPEAALDLSPPKVEAPKEGEEQQPAEAFSMEAILAKRAERAAEEAKRPPPVRLQRIGRRGNVRTFDDLRTVDGPTVGQVERPPFNPEDSEGR